MPSAARSLLPPLDAEHTELVPIAQQARDYAAAARSLNTRRTYRAQWDRFTTWCTYRGLVALPASPETVALYLTARAAERCAPSTLDVALAAIHKAHQLAGEPSPRSALVREVRAGIRRELGTAPREATPLALLELRLVVVSIPITEPIGLRDRALLLLGFCGAFRRSELVSLDISDLRFSAAGIEVRLRRSKTDQEGQGRALGIPPSTDPRVCPVRAVRAWIEAARLETGPLFLRCSRNGLVQRARLSDRAVARIVQSRAAAAGLPLHLLSGHSLRAGFVTAAARAGKPEHAIMRQTGHRSPAVLRRYIRRATVFEDNAANGLL